MKIRFAQEEDLQKIKNMWEYCFGDTEMFMNYYFDHKYKCENTLVVEDGSSVISSLQLNQYKIKINNNIYDTSYVVGVSTLPEARGVGAMKDLMSTMLNELYNKKQVVSILMPIDYRLYRRFGYEHCYDQMNYEIDMELLKDFRSKGVFKKASNKDIDFIINIYDCFLKDKNGYVKRDKNYYDNLFKEIESESGYVYIHENKELMDGYIIYFKMDDTMFVREIAYKNIDALKSILKFIYNHNTQFKKVSINSIIDDKIKLIIPALKKIDMNIKPFMMGRVINVENFIKDLNIKEDINLKLRVKDEFIDQNNKTFLINNKGIVFTDEKEDVSIDINTFSQLAFSYIDVDEAVFLGNIDMKDTSYIDNLKKMFNKKTNYINEYV
ncbi:GNAT family N-acetyltransferase [Tepidibacter hydrothermalis]|uniref:GNAT family N-acetyltransferase n=1 Tax=Tepidibacter hydrothermalis TaxID=3036126 RepID=A0ABY8EIQ7_9FIRM|nr:GNAT family N-acetyltransferase [Tepidibacter hydrothermalis]WFD11562.1 GNAT family N-acetyltransferase [Tepidibacter hydrothermalis]